MKVYIIRDFDNFTYVSFNKNFKSGEIIKEEEVNNYFELDRVFDNHSEELLDEAIVRIVNELLGDNK